MASMQNQPRHSLIFLFIIFLHIAISYSASSSTDDANALLTFKKTLKDESNALSSWNLSTPPCFENRNNWVGIICSRAGNIWGLRLENMGLSGSIDVDSLVKLSKLRSISLMHNSFSGELPDFRQLRMLKALFLSYNNFEGVIPPNAFDGIRRLRKIHLSFNKFSGEIPNSLATLQKLVEVTLQGNQFQGNIPDLKSTQNLQVFNVSNNQLQGSVPANLSKFDPSAFSGNKDLCGPPLNACPPSSSSSNRKTNTAQPSPAKSSDKPVPIAIIAVGVGMAIILAILIILIVVGINRSRKNNNNNNNMPSLTSNLPKKSMVEHDEEEGPNKSTNVVNGGVGRNNKSGENVGKLTFVRDDREKFDLSDLLKASAEILGSGSFGSSYKATLNNGNSVVVKRFKQMNNVGREEFQEHMRRLGRLSHPNLLPLVAYYYRKEEKLFVSDPVQKGSLALLLHGQTRGTPTLDWPTRLKVIKGVAKGLSYLYKELACLVAPHGHLKSSNVLLNASYEPLLGDYALIPLINQETVQEMMIAYKSPEYFNNGRITKKTDVWSLGILIIEVLTGKFPASYLQQGSEVDMTIWVRSVINDGYDKNMGLTKNSEGEMQKLLNIGMACCERNVDKRLDIKEACVRLEEVRERDREDDDFHSTCASTDADHRSSRGTSEDFAVIIN
ncbi:pollen receptor-like kinase 1 [Chenopodium quinoa]|uniref:pollen receptor-like kinase 1 n=1 Tax=Chenopodium quinoa TaxID=63459 RepID=UPI000B77CAD8|nr:pollen receptor-like kinase 1 [Chenopodium quinoa]